MKPEGIRVLMLNHNVRGRSTYFRAMGLGRVLAKRGHQVWLMTISPRARLRVRTCRVDGVNLVETPDLLVGSLRTGWDPWDTLVRCWFGLRHGPWDIVHAFDNRPAVILPALVISRAQRAVFCSDWADWWAGPGGVIQATRPWAVRTCFGWVESFFEEHFRDKACLVTVTSKALRERALALGLDGERVHYLPSGADPERIVPVDVEEARRRVGLPAERPVVEYMGFVQYDIGLALEAFVHLRKARPDVLFLLVGPLSRKVKRLVRELGLELGRDVVVTGPQPVASLSWWLGAADVLLLPYQNRQYNIGRGPIKLGDYLASGRPLVTNPVGDVGELLERHPFGLAASEDPQDFAAKIGYLLDAPHMRQSMGQLARSLAEGPLSWDACGQRLAGLYQELLKRPV